MGRMIELDKELNPDIQGIWIWAVVHTDPTTCCNALIGLSLFFPI